MFPVAGLAMVGAGAVCLGGALLARKWIAVISAAIMFAAMLDLAFLGLLPALFWALLLMFAGLLLGLELRLNGKPGTPDGSDGATAFREQRAAMTASALAYPMTAWLILWHGASPGPAPEGAHAGHGSTGLLSAAPALLAWLLLALLLAIGARAVVRKRVHSAVEAGAMAVMILAMLLMPH